MASYLSTIAVDRAQKHSLALSNCGHKALHIPALHAGKHITFPSDLNCLYSHSYTCTNSIFYSPFRPILYGLFELPL
jgi:hypothetical protein